MQWETFGTSYWEILPQINGYEICPIHLEPIRETSVSHQDIIQRFFPASSVLANNSPIEDVSRRRWIDSHWMAFFQMAQDIDYIFRLSATDFLLGVKIRRVLLYNLLPVRDRWEHTLLNDPVLENCADEKLSDYIASLYQDTYKLATQIPFAPAFVQLRICRLLFGDIKRFVSRRV